MKVHRIAGSVFACAVLWTAAYSQSAPADDELLVLGLRLADGSLCTVLADKDGARRAGDGLAIPRADGFWRGVILDRKQESISERVFFAYPAKSPANPPPLKVDEGCETNLTETVLFVGSDFVAVEENGGGYCEGAAHPYAFVGLKTFPIASETRPKAMSIEAALGQAARDAFEKTAEKAHGGEAKREEDCLSDAGPEDFGLVRIQGRWVIRGSMGHRYEACHGKHEYFSVAFDPPAKATGQTALATPYAQLAKEHPDLADAVFSPSGRLRVLLSKKGVSVVHGGKKSSLLELEGASIVMTQWALGKAAARWRQEIPQVLTK
jgi:hypothetical protein